VTLQLMTSILLFPPSHSHQDRTASQQSLQFGLKVGGLLSKGPSTPWLVRTAKTSSAQQRQLRPCGGGKAAGWNGSCAVASITLGGAAQTATDHPILQAASQDVTPLEPLPLGTQRGASALRQVIMIVPRVWHAP